MDSPKHISHEDSNNSSVTSGASDNSVTIKVKDKDGKDKEVTISVDKNKRTATVTVDGDTYDLTDVTISADGKTITGTFKKWGIYPVKVTITINCESDPPTVTVNKDVYTFTHAEQAKLIEYLKKNRPSTSATTHQDSEILINTQQNSSAQMPRNEDASMNVSEDDNETLKKY